MSPPSYPATGQSPRSVSPLLLTDGALRSRFAEAHRGARRAWPTVALSIEAYAAHVAQHLPADRLTEQALESLYASDLYLACACARNDAAALRAFEASCVPAIDGVLARYRLSSDDRAELKQRVRERVLVSDDGAARIARFSGRGSLRSWLCVIATREALALQGHASRHVPLGEERALHAFVTSTDSDLEQLKVRCGEAFQRAFAATLKELPAREQTLLRQHVVDGLTIDQLAALYRVHRSTAARSLERTRGALLSKTRARLRAELGVSSMELNSILRVARSRLYLTLGGLLRRGGSKPAALKPRAKRSPQ